MKLIFDYDGLQWIKACLQALIFICLTINTDFSVQKGSSSFENSKLEILLSMKWNGLSIWKKMIVNEWEQSLDVQYMYVPTSSPDTFQQDIMLFNWTTHPDVYLKSGKFSTYIQSIFLFISGSGDIKRRWNMDASCQSHQDVDCKTPFDCTIKTDHIDCASILHIILQGWFPIPRSEDCITICFANSFHVQKHVVDNVSPMGPFLTRLDDDKDVGPLCWKRAYELILLDVT